MPYIAFFALTVIIVAALMCIPAAILMWLLGLLAGMTGWPVAIGFWPSYIIVVILGLFFPRG